MKKTQLLLIGLLVLVITACIQDDIIEDRVPETFRITNAIDTLAKGGTYLLETRYTNNIGQVETAAINWVSSDESIIAVSADGVLTGVDTGTAEVYGEVQSIENGLLTEKLNIVVSDTTTTVAEISERTGEIRTTTFYVLEGDFTITQEGDDLNIVFADNYEASSSLPGLYVYLSNNPNSVANALEIGAVSVFSGAHSYTVPDVDIKEYDYLYYYCKPFRVKVGDGQIN
ncbi:MAG: hypothetical protein AAFO07_06340 [Bacteroidota bacterium]